MPTCTAAIRAFQIIDRADIIFGDGITLITAENSNGKSSIAKALAGALSADPKHGLTVAGVKALVRDGAKASTITITGPGATDTLTITYPKAETAITGSPIYLSRIGAGFDSIVDLDSKARGLTLAKLLKTEPSREDVAAALSDFGIKDTPSSEDIVAALSKAGKTADPTLTLSDHAKLMKELGIGLNVVDWVWTQIEVRGWDKTAKRLEEERATLKGRWSEVAGEAFGDKKASTWTPAGWTPDLAEASSAGLEAVLNAARMALETAVGQAAVDQSVIGNLRAEASKLDALKTAEIAAREAKMNAEVAVVNAQETHATAERNVANLLPAEQDGGLTCPHCNKGVHYHNVPDGKRLEKAERVTEEELKKRRLARASAGAKLSNEVAVLSTAKANLTTTTRALDDAQRAMASAEAAKRRLTELEASEAGKTGSADEADAARQAVAVSEGRVGLHQKKARADSIARQIGFITNIIAVLAPDGCRQAKLIKVLDTFNGGPLRSLCDAAGWAPVRIESDTGLTITYGGRPYAALNGHGPQISSDQFRTRVILQVALAQAVGDALVIIDAADILDQRGRNGMLGMLGKVNMSALVCMTFSAKVMKDGRIPDLETVKLGRTYWIANGVTRPIAEAVAAAQPVKKVA